MSLKVFKRKLTVIFSADVVGGSRKASLIPVA
jgi:hypothetical protein